MIFLINPFITSEERYGKDIGDIGGHQMPLGIYYLAASLLKAGIEVQVIDAEANRKTHEELVNILGKQTVNIIGITSTTVAFRNARSLAQMIRKIIPEAVLVIGGPHMTAIPELTIKTGDFDYGIVREGEKAFTQLIRYLLCGEGNLEDIPNLYYLKNGQVISNAKIEYINDLDSIPFPARHLCTDINIYKPPIGAFREQPVMNMVTSRGCPYECIFCDNNTFGRKTRFFSAEYVVNEITKLINDYGAKEIAFLDDTFVLNKKRLYRIFELLDENKIRFPWTCMTRVNNLTFELLKYMRDHGCWQIRIGIESGNQEVLNFIKKGITLDQVRNVTHWCKKLKINTSGFFMIGHHIDTPDTIQQTIDFACSLPLTDVVVTINTPIPGTESYQKARQFGTFKEDDWTSLNYWTPVFVPYGLTEKFMLKKQSEFYRRFYFRFTVLVRQLSKFRSFKILCLAIKNAILGLFFLQRGTRL